MSRWNDSHINQEREANEERREQRMATAHEHRFCKGFYDDQSLPKTEDSTPNQGQLGEEPTEPMDVD